MAIEWYYRAEDGCEQGPVNSSQLKRLADFGRVRPATLIRLAHEDRWEPASTVDGLFAKSHSPATTNTQSPSQTPVSEPARPAPLAAPKVPQAAVPQAAAPMAYVPPQPAATGAPPVAPVQMLAGGGAFVPPREWFCQVGGRVLGPLRVEEVRDLARLGRVEPASPISRGAGGPWFPAVQLAAPLGLVWTGSLPAGAGPTSGYAEYVPEPEAPEPIVTSVRSPRISRRPRVGPVFLILLVGAVALGLIGVGVTYYVVMHGSKILADLRPRDDKSVEGGTTSAGAESFAPEPLVSREEHVSTTGLHGRPKEQGDRFQSFASQASNLKWIPAADPQMQAEITKREARIVELLEELSVDFVTEPLEKDFKQLQTEYRTGTMTPQVYLDSLESVLKVLHRPAKGATP